MGVLRGNEFLAFQRDAKVRCRGRRLLETGEFPSESVRRPKSRALVRGFRVQRGKRSAGFFAGSSLFLGENALADFSNACREGGTPLSRAQRQLLFSFLSQSIAGGDATRGELDNGDIRTPGGARFQKAEYAQIDFFRGGLHERASDSNERASDSFRFAGEENVSLFRSLTTCRAAEERGGSGQPLRTP